MSRILIAGATGLVGSQVLTFALSDERITRVVAPTRRPLTPHPKLTNPVVDFDRLPADADWWAVDAMICALGTTRAVAGSAAAFRKVDLDYPLAMAGHARNHGARRMALTSSIGADAGSRFLYARTKGELEQAIGGLGFPSLTIVRPGLLGGKRAEVRLAERISGVVLRALAPVLPPRLRISGSDKVARVLLAGALNGEPGTHIIESDQLFGRHADKK